MREQLTQYVNLLFAGADDADEIRAEILQNTLDRYDDLLDQGKTPEAAYRLAIGGIGDVNEILGTVSCSSLTDTQVNNHQKQEESDTELKNRKLRAIAVVIYILCAIPLFILCDLGYETIGLSLTILLVACATYLMIITGKKETTDDPSLQIKSESSVQDKLKKSIESLVWAIGLAVYFLLSFTTKAWHITWIVFLIIGCTEGLVKAIIELMEEKKYER